MFMLRPVPPRPRRVDRLIEPRERSGAHDRAVILDEEAHAARERPVDVRVVAASHRDLRQLIAEGRFRDDLYHRLARFELTLPPLRERGRDTELLLRYATSRPARGNPRFRSPTPRPRTHPPQCGDSWFALGRAGRCTTGLRRRRRTRAHRI
jgi:hypothetical protein